MSRLPIYCFSLGESHNCHMALPAMLSLVLLVSDRPQLQIFTYSTITKIDNITPHLRDIILKCLESECLYSSIS